MVSLQEQLGFDYQNVLYAIPHQGASALHDPAGHVYPVQQVPALPFDRSKNDLVDLIRLDLPPYTALKLTPAQDAPAAHTFEVTESEQVIEIWNGDLALRIPASGQCDLQFPGPILGFCFGDGAWTGHTEFTGAHCCGRVETTIESTGPCCIQWRTEWRWGSHHQHIFRARWAAGSDTILVCESAIADTRSTLRWHPFDDTTSAWCWGGGERQDKPMERLTFIPTPNAKHTGQGERRLNALGHIGYFNQWCLAWAGFADASDRFLGLFSACGGAWRKRGFVRPEIWEDMDGSAFLQMPIRQGQRLYGFCLSASASREIQATDQACLPNRRKAAWSDLALNKVQQWELSPPLPPEEPQLIDPAWLSGFRQRLAKEPGLQARRDQFLSESENRHQAHIAACLWSDDTSRQAAGAASLCETAKSFVLERLCKGGYEWISIFQGRRVKLQAYDLDLLWAQGRISEDDYKQIRLAYLTLAYVYSDSDYCNYADFWPHTETEEGISEALCDEMGDTPVPPNFASEFFTTTGLMAELFPTHPLRESWCQFARTLTDSFLATFFEEDGTYHESINYHSHAMAELVTYFVPARLHGVHDYFSHPAVHGSYRHFVALAMPALEGTISWPGDGNSGSKGAPQRVRSDVAIAAAMYRDADPELAGELMHLWRGAGRPILGEVHPTLLLLLLNPDIQSKAPAWQSIHRRSLGIVSKAILKTGEMAWCSFRAGKATHHMCFDQGHLHWVVGDQELLGDHGYHTCDNDGTSLPAASTYLHSTCTYGPDRNLTSGYTGLEHAPEPLAVHLSESFDWVVHRIENDNYRDLVKLRYRHQIPCPRTIHTRHYLYCKPDCILLWDTFDATDANPTLWFTPRKPVEQAADDTFVAGALRVQCLTPTTPTVIENRQVGPLWSLGLQNPDRIGFLTVLNASGTSDHPRARVEGDSISLWSRDREIRVHLPEPDDTDRLPTLTPIRQ